MVYISILFVLIAVVIAACSAKEGLSSKPHLPTSQASPTTQLPQFIDFRVSNVRLGDTEKKVLKELGKPKTRRVVAIDNCGITEVLKLIYSGLEVQMDKDLKGEWFVLELIVTSSEVSIEPQVKIGDYLGKVKTSFENPNVERKDTDEPVLYYLTRDNDNAQFEFKNNKLARVRLYVNPC